ncbi:1130_t:CDS:2, partial [Dentiscutata erythropus]
KAIQYAMNSLELVHETKNTIFCVEELKKNYHKKINQIKNSQGEWDKYWKNVIQIDTAIVNILGKVAIRNILSQKASKKEVLAWKTSSAMFEAKSKSICCRSKLNQEFAIVVIDMMFDPTIMTTSHTGGEIHSRIETQSKQINNIIQDDNAEDINILFVINGSDYYPELSLSGTSSSTNHDDNYANMDSDHSC